LNFLGYTNDSLGYKILDISTNSIISVRDVYFLLKTCQVLFDTTFFCDKYIDSIINFSDLLIEGKYSDIDSNSLNSNYNLNYNNNNIQNKNPNSQNNYLNENIS